MSNKLFKLYKYDFLDVERKRDEEDEVFVK